MGKFLDAEQQIIELCKPLNVLNCFSEVQEKGIMETHTLKRLVQDGEIQAVKIRGQWKVFKSEVESYLLNNLSKNYKKEK